MMVQVVLVSVVGLTMGALVISPASTRLPWLLPLMQGMALLTVVVTSAKWYRSRTSPARESRASALSRVTGERGMGVRTPQAVQALVNSGKPLPEIVRRTKMPHDAISLLLSLSRVHQQATA